MNTYYLIFNITSAASVSHLLIPDWEICGYASSKEHAWRAFESRYPGTLTEQDKERFYNKEYIEIDLPDQTEGYRDCVTETVWVIERIDRLDNLV